MEALRSLAAVLCLFSALYMIGPSLCCNEAVCASIASKCMLTGSCKCDMTNLTNCSCCKECATCLHNLYDDCCYCFKMCPKPENWSNLASEVEDFPEPEAGLFNILTESPDEAQRWISYTFPVDHHINGFQHMGKQYTIKIVSVDAADDPPDDQTTEHVTFNCTVAYLTQCLSRDKCSKVCRGMGASSARWFQNGCCECVGSACVNYGINQSRCLRCSEEEDAYISDGELDDALIGYGDDESNVLK